MNSNYFLLKRELNLNICCKNLNSGLNTPLLQTNSNCFVKKTWCKFKPFNNFKLQKNIYSKIQKTICKSTNLKLENVTIQRFWNQCFDKGRLKAFVFWFLKNYGENKTIELLEQLKNVGFDYATKAGVSLSIDDLKIPPEKSVLMFQAETQIREALIQYKKGNITGVEKFQKLIDTWHRTSELLKQEVINHFEQTDILNPVYMMAFSGARGNISQVRQLVGMRGLMADPQGRIIDFPIRSNFREGLTLTEYIISSYGARKGIVDTALRTANAGYLTRRLVDVAQHVIVSDFDCGTKRGIFISDMKEANKTIYSVQNRLIGRVLAKDISLPNKKFFRNQEISSDIAAEIVQIKNKSNQKTPLLERIFIRSPLTCQTRKLVCQLCYGWSLANGNLVSIGEAVGIIAAQSIGEPGTQLTMRTFHTGGVFSGNLSDQIIAPYNGIIEYSESIAGTLIRTPQGEIAFLTKNEGSFVLKPQENLNDDSLNKQIKANFYKIPAYTVLFARNKEKIYFKQVIAQISTFSKQKKQRDDAEQNIKSELEGELYSGHIDIIEQLNDFDDLKYQAWDWGYVWILAGKIYKLPIKSNFFPNVGDLINRNSILNSIQWVISDSCCIQIKSLLTNTNVLPINSKNFAQNKELLSKSLKSVESKSEFKSESKSSDILLNPILKHRVPLFSKYSSIKSIKKNINNFKFKNKFLKNSAHTNLSNLFFFQPNQIKSNSAFFDEYSFTSSMKNKSFLKQDELKSSMLIKDVVTKLKQIDSLTAFLFLKINSDFLRNKLPGRNNKLFFLPKNSKFLKIPGLSKIKNTQFICSTFDFKKIHPKIKSFKLLKNVKLKQDENKSYLKNDIIKTTLYNQQINKLNYLFNQFSQNDLKLLNQKEGTLKSLKLDHYINNKIKLNFQNTNNINASFKKPTNPLNKINEQTQDKIKNKNLTSMNYFNKNWIVQLNHKKNSLKPVNFLAKNLNQFIIKKPLVFFNVNKIRFHKIGYFLSLSSPQIEFVMHNNNKINENGFLSKMKINKVLLKVKQNSFNNKKNLKSKKSIQTSFAINTHINTSILSSLTESLNLDKFFVPTSLNSLQIPPNLNNENNFSKKEEFNKTNDLFLANIFNSYPNFFMQWFPSKYQTNTGGIVHFEFSPSTKNLIKKRSYESKLDLFNKTSALNKKNQDYFSSQKDINLMSVSSIQPKLFLYEASNFKPKQELPILNKINPIKNSLNSQLNKTEILGVQKFNQKFKWKNTVSYDQFNLLPEYGQILFIAQEFYKFNSFNFNSFVKNKTNIKNLKLSNNSWFKKLENISYYFNDNFLTNNKILKTSPIFSEDEKQNSSKNVPFINDDLNGTLKLSMNLNGTLKSSMKSLKLLSILENISEIQKQFYYKKEAPLFYKQNRQGLKKPFYSKIEGFIQIKKKLISPIVFNKINFVQEKNQNVFYQYNNFRPNVNFLYNNKFLLTLFVSKFKTKKGQTLKNKPIFEKSGLLKPTFGQNMCILQNKPQFYSLFLLAKKLKTSKTPVFFNSKINRSNTITLKAVDEKNLNNVNLINEFKENKKIKTPFNLIDQQQYNVQIKQGWLYIPKNLSEIAKYHKSFVNIGKKTIDNLFFDTQMVYLECVAINTTLFNFSQNNMNFFIKDKKINDELIWIKNTQTRFKPKVKNVKQNKKPILNSNELTLKNSFVLLIRKVHNYPVTNKNELKNKIYELNQINKSPFSSIVMYEKYKSCLLNKQTKTQKFLSTFPNSDLQIKSVLNYPGSYQLVSHSMNLQNREQSEDVFLSKIGVISVQHRNNKKKISSTNILSKSNKKIGNHISNINQTFKLFKSNNILNKQTYFSKKPINLFGLILGFQNSNHFDYLFKIPLSTFLKNNNNNFFNQHLFNNNLISNSKNLSNLNQNKINDDFNRTLKSSMSAKNNNLLISYLASYLMLKNKIRSKNKNTNVNELSNFILVKPKLNSKVNLEFSAKKNTINSELLAISKTNGFLPNFTTNLSLDKNLVTLSSNNNFSVNNNSMFNNSNLETIYSKNRVTNTKKSVISFGKKAKYFANFVNSFSDIFCLPCFDFSLGQQMAYLLNHKLFSHNLLNKNLGSISNSKSAYNKKISMASKNIKISDSVDKTSMLQSIKSTLESSRKSPIAVEKYNISETVHSYPTNQNKFLFYDKNLIKANRPFAFTSFLSPFEGEILPNKNQIWKNNNSEINTPLLGQNNQLILTSADLISFSLPEKNFKETYKTNFINNLKLKTSESPPVFIKYNNKISKINGLRLGFPKQKNMLNLGEFFFYGDTLSKDIALQQSGQLIHINNSKITLRRGQPIFVSTKAILHGYSGDFINKNDFVITLPYQRLKTGDIIQGIPKVEQFFESRITKRGRLFRDSLPNLLKGLFNRYKLKFPLQKAVRHSVYKIQQIIVDGVLRVYRSQGVTIADKHLEVIVRQMTSKVRILNGGQTGFFPGELVDLEFVEHVNQFLMKKIKYEPIVLGITKASLEVDSFLSSASFQQTTRMLSRAALDRKKDFLKGLKENVIVGNLIPAGTGYLVHLDDIQKRQNLLFKN